MKIQLKITFIILLISIIGNKSVASNNPKIDSLKTVIATTTDSARLYAYQLIAWEMMYSNTQQASVYIDSSIYLAHRLKNFKGLSSAYNYKGITYDIQSNSDSAIYYYQKAHDEAVLSESENIVRMSLNNMGLVYWNQGHYAKAVEKYAAAAELHKKVNDLKSLGNTLNNIGLVYRDQKNGTKAIEYYKMALNYYTEANHKYGIGAALANIAVYFDDYGNKDSALYYNLAALEIKSEINDMYGIGFVMNNIGAVYRSINETSKALYYYKESLNIKYQLNDNYGKASCYYNIGTCYLDSNLTDSALHYLHLSEKEISTIENLKLLTKVMYQLGYVYKLKADYKQSAEYLVKAYKLRDSLYSSELSEQLAEAETRYETKIKEEKINQLFIEKEIQGLEIKQYKTQTYFWIFAFVSSIILSFMFYNRYKLKQKSMLDAALINEQKEGLKAVILATEDERKRIAKELHDGIGQTLSGIKLSLQSVTDEMSEKQKQKLIKVGNSIDDACDEIRTISHQMMPRVLQEVGLLAAISDMLEKSLGNTSIKYQFEHHGIESRLPETIEISLYRISQELINNVVKHSLASETNIQLTKVKGFIILRVEDNGKGISFDKGKSDGIGLMNIKSRLNTINGHLDFESVSNKGLLTTIRIPIHESPPKDSDS